jgi:hypothetical protein
VIVVVLREAVKGEARAELDRNCAPRGTLFGKEMLNLLRAVCLLALLLLLQLPAAAADSATVNPARGPIGGSVILEGSGCNNPGQSAYFMFGNEGGLSGTVGGVDFAVPVDSAGRFRTTFVIPASLHSYQGMGGGTVTAGQYEFVSFPPLCIVPFTVVGGPATLAAGGLGPGLALGLALLGVGLALSLLSLPRWRGKEGVL